MILDLPPQLILPDHYVARKPAIIRPMDESLRKIIEAEKQKANLPGIGGVKGGSAPFITFLQRYQSTSFTSSTWTTTTLTFGTASADRLLVAICSTTSSSSNDCSISAVRIGGNTAAIQQNAKTGTAYVMNCALAQLLVPTGTSGVVAFDVVGSTSNCCVDLYAITGYRSATPYHSNKTALEPFTTTTTMTLNISSTGVTLVNASIDELISNLAPGLTVGASGQISANELNCRSAWVRKPGTAAGQVYTTTHTNSDRRAMVGATWR